jgi:hypothetical protein
MQPKMRDELTLSIGSTSIYPHLVSRPFSFLSRVSRGANPVPDTGVAGIFLRVATISCESDVCRGTLEHGIPALMPDAPLIEVPVHQGSKAFLKQTPKF